MLSLTDVAVGPLASCKVITYTIDTLSLYFYAFYGGGIEKYKKMVTS